MLSLMQLGATRVLKSILLPLSGCVRAKETPGPCVGMTNELGLRNGIGWAQPCRGLVQSPFRGGLRGLGRERGSAGSL